MRSPSHANTGTRRALAFAKPMSAILITAGSAVLASRMFSGFRSVVGGGEVEGGPHVRTQTRVRVAPSGPALDRPAPPSPPRPLTPVRDALRVHVRNRARDRGHDVPRLLLAVVGPRDDAVEQLAAWGRGT